MFNGNEVEATETLKEALVSVIDKELFDKQLADQLLNELREKLGPHPFEEEEPLESDPDNDLLFHAIEFGTVSSVRWILENRVMGPPDVNVGLYSALALSSELADEEIIRYLLQDYGADFSEICFGDLDPERKELAIEMGVVEDADDE